MTEPEDPVLSGPPSEVPDDVEILRTCGAIGLVVGGVLCVGALLIDGGRPSWQVLAVFMLVVLVGLGLRLEAALRERSRS
ncbi:hypothetical protein [Nonomuraea sp. NEAU-A123]|uniref:hypothetical protein n=1 Tax=Nonomuraea sp. NEAU-A123 TaxID=2839649 RepID=UPI001BE412C6|nr:hypothetical protein [Nonomuraea sp. NEAU-A123]MBT2226832.1 hypothetical protein [Nonomuraea sp. NEAU-A123]